MHIHSHDRMYSRGAVLSCFSCVWLCDPVNLNTKLCDRQLFQSVCMYFFFFLLHIYQNFMRKFCCLHFSDHAKRSNILNQDTASRGKSQACNASLLAFYISMLPLLCSVWADNRNGDFEWQCLLLSFFPFSRSAFFFFLNPISNLLHFS